MLPSSRVTSEPESPRSLKIPPMPFTRNCRQNRATPPNGASSSAVVSALRALSVDPEADSVAASVTGRRAERPLERPPRPVVQCDTVAVPAGVGTAMRIRCCSINAACAPSQRRSSARRTGRRSRRPTVVARSSARDLFANGSTSQFDANVAGPVDASYKLGPGDQLVLLLTGEVELAHRLDVNARRVHLHPAGGPAARREPVAPAARGHALRRARARVSGRPSRANATTRFSVSVARLRSLQVFVTGDVEHPGSYRVSPPARHSRRSMPPAARHLTGACGGSKSGVEESSSRRSTSTTTSCEATRRTTHGSSPATSCSCRFAGRRCASSAK